MFFDNSDQELNVLIAKSADLTNKPFLHSVLNLDGEYDFDTNDLDISFQILCRDIEGKRQENMDLELELFRSSNDIVLVIAKLNFPEDPILWSGSKNLWMDSKSGKKCDPPTYSFRIENLANRIKTILDQN